MNTTQEQAIKTIEGMSDTEVLVTAALAAAEIYGQIQQHWQWVAEVYGDKAYSEERASLIIEEKLGDEYQLDVDTCREWLITDAQYKNEDTSL